jgi:hypothetical protein
LVYQTLSASSFAELLSEETSAPRDLAHHIDGADQGPELVAAYVWSSVEANLNP